MGFEPKRDEVRKMIQESDKAREPPRPSAAVAKKAPPGSPPRLTGRDRTDPVRDLPLGDGRQDVAARLPRGGARSYGELWGDIPDVAARLPRGGARAEAVCACAVWPWSPAHGRYGEIWGDIPGVAMEPLSREPRPRPWPSRSSRAVESYSWYASSRATLPCWH